MAKVESFQLDDTIVKAPYVRAAGVERDEKGSTVQKYDALPATESRYDSDGCASYT